MPPPPVPAQASAQHPNVYFIISSKPYTETYSPFSISGMKTWYFANAALRAGHQDAGKVAFRFHEHPPEIFTAAQFELDQIIADAQACAGPEDFHLPVKIVVEGGGPGEVFPQEDLLGYLAEDVGPAVELVSELGEK